MSEKVGTAFDRFVMLLGLMNTGCINTLSSLNKSELTRKLYIVSYIETSPFQATRRRPMSKAF